MTPFAKALTMPVWLDSGFDVPEDVELRREGDLAALHLLGTSKVLGFVPSRVNKDALPGLVLRLRAQN